MPMDKYEYELKRQRGETKKVAVTRLSKWIPLCFICYCGYRAIAVLAGKSTLAQFGMWIIADVRLNKIVSHAITTVFGLGGITYGYRERKLRHKTIDRMGNQIVKLEEKIDPGRSSSRLTRKGTTRPEDEI
ncbi:MAG: hypothetical protein ACYC0Z_08320 [Acidobacteriaceae bacterium]